MQYTASDFRAMARGALRGKWGVAILVTLIASILGAGTGAAIFVEFEFKSDAGFVMELLGNSYPLVPVGALSLFLAIGIVIWSIFQLVIGGAMTLGYKQFYQNLIRGQEADFGILFIHRHKLWQGFCIGAIQGLYIILWSLCLIVPGIMASYSCAMAHYIANDNPEMTASETIAASKEMMKGHRWRLFCLELSFIGWDLLGALTLGIGSYAVSAYIETARVCFYQDLCQNRMNSYGYANQNDYMDENGYVNQNDYMDENGYVNQDDYMDENGYANQNDYMDENGYVNQNDYNDNNVI